MIGEVFYADLSPVVGNELGGMRPVVVIQEDGATATVALLRHATPEPTEPPEPSVSRTIVTVIPSTYYLEFAGQIRTVDQSRLHARVGTMSKSDVKDLRREIIRRLNT